MKKSILYILQHSVYNNENKWSIADSNLNMFLDMASALYDIDKDIHFYCFIAPIEDFYNLNEYTELYSKSNVTFIPYKFPVDAFTNRFAFDPQYFINKFNELPKIDAIWNNIVELTLNMKVALFQIKQTPKIISCNYWLDAPEIGQEKVDKSISYDIRQWEGFHNSDLCIFTCESTKNAWLQNAKYKFNQKYTRNIIKKSSIWDFGFSSAKCQNAKVEFKPSTYTVPTILFLNRLSGINYTHHQQFIDAVNELFKERQDFRVFFTNPSQKVTNLWLKENVKPYIELIKTPLSRKEYFKLLTECNISVHLFLKELYGGCAHREATYFDNLIQVVPEVNEYARIHGKNYPFYVKEDFSNLKEILNKAIDNFYTNTYTKPKKIFNENLKSSFEECIKTVYADIIKLFK